LGDWAFFSFLAQVLLEAKQTLLHAHLGPETTCARVGCVCRNRFLSSGYFRLNLTTKTAHLPYPPNLGRDAAQKESREHQT
jgi:hypothetical protein